MEDIVALSAQPCGPQRPGIGCDERPSQLRANRCAPLPRAPGRVPRLDDADARQGTCTLCMVVPPLRGRRPVEGSQPRTEQDVAHGMPAVVDASFPAADILRGVWDKLSTHTPAALAQAFEPAEARRIARKLERHDTPTQGRWLHMTESARSVLARQCLRRRLGDSPTTQREVAAWEHIRHWAKATGHWRVATEDARSKCKRLYPKNHCG
jgi:DDE superfamily endonuclease